MSDYQIQQEKDGIYYVYSDQGVLVGGSRTRDGAQNLIQKVQETPPVGPDQQYGITQGDTTYRQATQTPQTANEAEINGYNRRMDYQRYVANGGNDEQVLNQLRDNIYSADTQLSRFIQTDSQGLQQIESQRNQLFSKAVDTAGTPDFNNALSQAFTNEENYQTISSGNSNFIGNNSIGNQTIKQMSNTLLSPFNDLANNIGNFESLSNSGGSQDPFGLGNMLSNAGGGDSTVNVNGSTQYNQAPDVYTGQTDHRVRIKPKKFSLLDSPMLIPLRETNGMLFPYTPTIQYNQNIHYTGVEPMHSNQDYQLYRNTASVEVNISGQFTAQNRAEALYLASVIHFLRSVSKMRFGEDEKDRGLPPPVLMLSGYGKMMFNQVPVIMRNFSLNLEPNVDYVRAEFRSGEVDTTIWVPTLTTISVSLIVQKTPAEWRKSFTWDKFASGKLLNEGWV